MFRSMALTIWLTGALACMGNGAHDTEQGEHSDHPGHNRTHVSQCFVPEGAGAPLFSDLGDHSREITTNSDLAARYFNQGLTLAYGFNHDEALRSFQEASRQDPSCAMCPWGEAIVLGPNINKPMSDDDVASAYAAVRRALAATNKASPVERALIEALAKRYAPAPIADRANLDLDYANAMRQVATRFPDDLDVQTLFAEALMDTMPWDYFVDPDTPRPTTVEALAALEHVMVKNPKHPGALHLYIHAVEPSSSPERGEPAADTLGPLVPGAGHLVHMPSHIYLRVGRYHDASLANELAASADESYITQCRAQGFYPAAYYPHNVHFLYSSAAFEGRARVSIDAARKLSANMTAEIVRAVPITEEFAPMELYALARFGRWTELSKSPAPPVEWRYVTGVWNFTRGMAAAASGNDTGANQSLQKLESIASEAPLAVLYFASGATPAQLLTIGSKVLRARMASEAGQHGSAITYLEEAVALQDALPYTEPPPWYFPNREALGMALLRAGHPEDAEATYRKQLAHTPRNGWSLSGLVQSLDAQGKDSSPAEAQRLEAWKRADTVLNGSTF